MNHLPDSWATCLIGDISPVIGGGTPPSRDPSNFTDSGGIPWITPADLSGYRETWISRGERNLTEKGFSASSAKMLPRGALLFSSRAPVGYVAIAANPVCTNQGFKSFVLPDEFDPRFGFFYLCHIKPIAEERATGTTFKELSGGAAAQLPFVVAPPAEQKRIADKLEAVLRRVDACRSRLDRIPVLLKRFRQSVLAAAASGEVTREWRVKHLPENIAESAYPSRPLRDLVKEPLRNGKSVRDGHGVPVLRLTALRNGRFNWSETKRGDWTNLDVERYLAKNGDFLVIRGNGSQHLVGRGGLVVDAPVKVAFPDTMIRVRPNETLISPSFLSLLWDTEEVRTQIESAAKTTTGLWKVAQDDLEAITLPVPSLSEQHEIVRCVEILLASADRMEARLKDAQKTIERLPTAILSKAFCGNLVPQDPEDEPATSLLKRISLKLKDEKVQPKRRNKTKRANMQTLSKNSLKEAIFGLAKDTFTFADLRAVAPGEYDALANAVLELLGEKNPSLKQVFDEKGQKMQFQRIR